MRFKQKISPISILALGLLLQSLSCFASGINAVSCSQKDVQNAINSAANGDNVLVPAGPCSWSSAVTIPDTKGITLQGAGIGSTVITNATGDTALIINIKIGNALTRVTGFSFNGNLARATDGHLRVSATTDAPNAFRIDHNSLYGMTGGRAIAVVMSGQNVSGVIDHNTITKPSGTLQGITVFGSDVVTSGSDPTAGAPFGQPLALGTADNIFVEDNTFDYSASDETDGAFDTAGAARLVFRHNTMIHTDVGNHGADSGGYRGAYTVEVYGNTFTNSGANIWVVANLRSGIWMMYNNTITGLWGGTYLHNYRSCSAQNAVWQQTGGGTGLCDGTNAWDTNMSGLNGWACLDEVGHHFGTTLSGVSTINPMYSWNNPKNGTDLPASNAGGCAAETADIVENREFFNYNASCSGSKGSCTSGVGVGLLANRPGSCTANLNGYIGANPAYFATDDGPRGSLYQCTATNTWTKYYTPYTYPHPLQSVTTLPLPPMPPTNLRGTVN